MRELVDVRYPKADCIRLVQDNLSVLKEIDHPNADLLPDTFHMSIEEADVATSLRDAGDRVAHVHLGDNNRLMPGHGRLDWEGIFGALKDIGFEGAVNLECSTEGARRIDVEVEPDELLGGRDRLDRGVPGLQGRDRLGVDVGGDDGAAVVQDVRRELAAHLADARDPDSQPGQR